MNFDMSAISIYALRSALLIAAFVAFAWALWRERRHAERSTAHLGDRLETALGEIRRLTGQVIALGGTLETLGTRLNQTTSRAAPPPPPPPSASGNPRGYETAIRMARGGASVEEIVASCGTTRAEAKLLRRLHECSEPRKADAETMKIA